MKRSIWFQLMLVLLICAVAQAQTHVGGIIASDVTWSGTVCLDANVTVTNGATLRLDNTGNATRILATGNYTIFINGGNLMSVNASAQNKIVLKTYDGVVQWGGLVIQGFENGNMHTLQFLKIQNALCGITASPNIANTVVVDVDNCRLEYNSTGIIANKMSATPGIIQITNCSINHSGTDGIYAFDLPLRTVNGYAHCISNCEINDNNECGIHLVRCPASFRIFQNEIHDNIVIPNINANGITCIESDPTIFRNEIIEPRGFALGCAMTSAPSLMKEPNTFKTDAGFGYAVVHGRNGFPVMSQAYNNFINLNASNRMLIVDESSPPVVRKVLNNYWGMANPYATYFSPVGYYAFAPYQSQLIPLGPFTYGTYSLDDSCAYDLLKEGLEAESEDNYTLAYGKFTDLINTYPEAEDPICMALPHVLSSGQNAGISLETLYQIFDNLFQQNPSSLLGQTARQARNDCQIAGQIFSEPINDFAAIAGDPPTVMDSVFALSNLDQISLIMENLGLPGPQSFDPAAPKTLQQYRSREADLMALLASVPGQNPNPTVAQPRFLTINSVYPNPFNPTTAISYQLSANCQVSLRVYDTAGRLVTTLVDGWRAAGNHEVTFDGAGLASGLYLYRLQAGKSSASGKMILMK